MIEIRLPSSKSVTHRALILAARSSQPCDVAYPLMGADCRSTLAVIEALGAQIERRGEVIRFLPMEGGWRAPSAPLDCGNSGTTLRLMIGQAAASAAPITLTGDASLQRRPNGPLLVALEGLGALVDSAEGRAPLRIQGPISSGGVRLPPRTSSQFATALILAAAMHAEGVTRISMDKPVASRPYLHVTLEVAAAFGLSISVTETDTQLSFEAEGPQRPSLDRFEVEGDWSAAAFPLVAGAILDKPVRLKGLRRGSTQGDEVVVELVGRFGPRVAWRGPDLELSPAPLEAPGAVDLEASPDLFPALVALAARADGETIFVNAPSLRHKECDRIAAMAAGLGSLGIACEERADGLWVRGGSPTPGPEIAAHHDHRIHMAFALLAAETPGISVADRGCEAISYPGFYGDLGRILQA